METPLYTRTRPAEQRFASAGKSRRCGQRWGQRGQNGDIEPWWFGGLESEQCACVARAVDHTSNPDGVGFHRLEDEVPLEASDPPRADGCKLTHPSSRLAPRDYGAECFQMFLGRLRGGRAAKPFEECGFEAAPG